MKNYQGTIITDREGIANIIFNFYSSLFSSQNPNINDIEFMSNFIPNSVDQDMSKKLDCPFNKEEVRKAMFDLSPSKAPSPNGFTALFSKMFGT